MKLSPRNASSLMISCIGILICCILIKSSLKNFKLWTKQRLLRFSTSMLLLLMVICYTVTVFSFDLQPDYVDFSAIKTECKTSQVLGIVFGIGFSVTYPAYVILAIHTTLDRYECLTLFTLNDSRKMRIRIFSCYTITLALASLISAVWYYLYPCFEVPFAVSKVSVLTLGSLSMVYAISDTILNLLMIRQVRVGVSKGDEIEYGETRWEKFMKRIGIKRQLYGYFFLLVASLLLVVALVTINSLGSAPKNDETFLLITIFSISLYVPFHVMVTFR